MARALILFLSPCSTTTNECFIHRPAMVLSKHHGQLCRKRSASASLPPPLQSEEEEEEEVLVVLVVDAALAVAVCLPGAY